MSNDTHPAELYVKRCGCILGSLVPHGGQWQAEEDKARAEYRAQGGECIHMTRLQARTLMRVTADCPGHRGQYASG